MRRNQKVERFVKQHGATVLTYVGAAGVVGTSILTAQATTKASDILRKATDKKGDALTTKEKINYALPVYIPPIIMGAATITCIFGANIINQKHQASLLTAYGVLDSSYREYRNKVNELYGEHADNRVQVEMEKDNVREEDLSTHVQLFYDEYSDRFFESTSYQVQRAQYELNREIFMANGVALNHWYDMLGLDPVKDGYALGWTMDSCFEMYWQPWLDFNCQQKKTDDGRVYYSIGFWQDPIMDFENYC